LAAFIEKSSKCLRGAKFQSKCIAFEKPIVHPGGMANRGLFAQRIDLPGRNGDVKLTGSSSAALDAIVLDGLFDFIEVLLAQGSKEGHFIRPPISTVGVTVGQARSTKTAISPRSMVGNSVHLQEQYGSIWRALERSQRGP
jgi:hypothetical protein